MSNGGEKSDPRTAGTGAGPSKSVNCRAESTTLPRLLTSREAASYLGIGARQLWALQNCGAIPHIRVGTRTVRFAIDDLDQFIAARRRGGARR